MSFILERIKELGYELPEPPKPVASYITAIRSGNLIYTSGMLPVRNGKILYTDKIGGEKNSVDEGYNAAQLCALNALSVINELVSLDDIERIIKITGYVNSAKNFTEQPKVINGASDLAVEIFQEKGKHVRAAVGVAELPLDVSVEIDMIVEVKNN